jgi:hypothetical protein
MGTEVETSLKVALWNLKIQPKISKKRFTSGEAHYTAPTITCVAHRGSNLESL